ncbi:hypothetical protein DN730_02780 [Marinomonas piezotolerans]|uniref:Uncharacterized protein n=1 Tax=Marinomonas piezotolerans TaxID=2213058 RepID=A0A370UDX1_9GAMM|nr:hypothetical protein DN730_02780 [Marinomonas piezotolerans]
MVRWHSNVLLRQFFVGELTLNALNISAFKNKCDASCEVGGSFEYEASHGFLSEAKNLLKA